MKSFFLDGMGEMLLVRNELSRLFPSQCEPWVLTASDEDPIAYFNLFDENNGAWLVQVDIGGRHFDRSPSVLGILKELQEKVGGRITDDDDNKL